MQARGSVLTFFRPRPRKKCRTDHGAPYPIEELLRKCPRCDSARARGRLLAQDGRDRARAENKKMAVWAGDFYKQVTRDAGLCSPVDQSRSQSIGLNMNRSS